MSGVPRVASFDDLRQGQLVTWTDGLVVESGKTQLLDQGGYWVVRDTHRTTFTINRHECNAGEVTILCDAPDPPVQVRRADYDALAAALAQRGITPATDLGRAARALIDNADTGGE